MNDLLSASPNVIVPRHSVDPLRPEAPSVRYCTATSGTGRVTLRRGRGCNRGAPVERRREPRGSVVEVADDPDSWSCTDEQGPPRGERGRVRDDPARPGRDVRGALRL